MNLISVAQTQFANVFAGGDFPDSPIPATFSTTPTVGRSVVAIVVSQGNNDATVDDNQGNTYTKDYDSGAIVSTNPTAGTARLAAFSAPIGTSSGTFTVSAHSTFGFHLMALWIIEVGPAIGGLAFDLSVIAQSNSSGTPDSGATGLPAAANELSIGWSILRASTGATPVTYTDMGHIGISSNNYGMDAAYKIYTSGGAQQETWSAAGNSWAAGVLSWRSAAQIIQPISTSSAGNWTAQPSGTLYGNLTDNSDTTYDDLAKASAPSAMVLGVTNTNTPTAAQDGYLQVRVKSA